MKTRRILETGFLIAIVTVCLVGAGYNYKGDSSNDFTGDVTISGGASVDGTLSVGATLTAGATILGGPAAVAADAPFAVAIFGQANTGIQALTTPAGAIGEAVSGTTLTSIGIGMSGGCATTGGTDCYAVSGTATPGAAGDTAEARAGHFVSSTSHAGGINTALYAFASSGSTNYAFYGDEGQFWQEDAAAFASDFEIQGVVGIDLERTLTGDGSADVDMLTIRDGSSILPNGKLWYDHSDTAIETNGKFNVGGSSDFTGTAVFNGLVSIASAGNLTISSTSGGAFGIDAYDDDGAHIWVRPIDGTGNRNFIFTDFANYLNDHDHAALSADPTIFLHSATDPDSNNTEWMSMTHDKTDAQITTGKGHLTLNAVAGSDIVLGNTASTIDGESLTLVGNTVKYVKKDGEAAFVEHISMAAGSASPGGSGPTAAANNRTAYWLLNATNEFLYFTTDTHADSCWDGGTLWVEVVVMLTAAETSGDDIDATLEWESYAKDVENQSSASTETRSVDHDIGSDNAQWMTHTLTFLLTPATTAAGEIMAFKFYLDDISGGTPVAEVGFVHADVHWRSVCPTPTRFTTVPAEG